VVNAPGTSLRLRRRLVRELEQRGLIRSARASEALLEVPRELFLPEFAAREGLGAVYRDEAILTKSDASGLPISSSSQPAIMAEMLEQLAVEPGMHVLEIGAGTGYNAALLSVIVGSTGRVVSIEIDDDIARAARTALREGGYRVHVVAGDGRDGYPERAPYDRIIVTASSDAVPKAWFDQLVDGGLIVVPLRIATAGVQAILTLRKAPGKLVTASVVCGGFMPLRSSAAADSTPRPPPRLIASDATTVGPSPPLRQISGEALVSLSPEAKRRLVSVALAEGRSRPLGLRADARSLALYLTLALPAARAVSVSPGWTIGLISRDGRSLAYIESHAHLGKRWISSLTAHGGTAAEQGLCDAIDRWDQRGRPGAEELAITVDYRTGTPKLRRRWRTSLY
jgi:protein-L-isoaspartate(D-aspartate) O-methyltransferase